MPNSVRRRFAPLVLATTILALAATACSAEETDSGKGSTSPSAEATESTEPTTDESASDDGEAGGVCATGDLKLTVTEESQAGGYYLITATAKSGVTCTLEGLTVAAAFGSNVEGDVQPAEQAVSDSITMSGSTKAYAGVNPHSGPQDGGIQFDEIIVAAHAEDPDPVSLKLPSTAEVDRPVGSNWRPDAADVVPFVS